jgi:hypothetical protein
MAIDVDGDKDQVMAFLCGLVCECGDNPSFEQAKAYSRRFSSLINPNMAVEILGVKSWNEVLNAYDRYISGHALGIKGGKRRKKGLGDSSRRYSYDELVEILSGLYDEFGGEMSESLLSERAHRIQTPAYATFVKYLGPMKHWPKIIAEASEKKAPDHTAH